MTGSGALCVVSYLLASLSPVPVLALVGCGLCGLSVGIMCPEPSALRRKNAPRAELPCLRILRWPVIWAVLPAPRWWE